MERPEQNQNVPVKTWAGFTEWAEILARWNPFWFVPFFKPKRDIPTILDEKQRNSQPCIG